MGRLTRNKDRPSGPPCWAEWLLSRFSPAGLEDELQGDLLEMYTYWVRTAGPAKARWRYALAVLRLMRPFSGFSHKRSEEYPKPNPLDPDMIINYCKIAWRNLRKHRTYASLNITGLSLGISCALLLFALVRYHYSFDKHHRNYDRIYRVNSAFLTPDGDFLMPNVPDPFGKALRNDHPAIEQVAMLDEYNEPFIAIPVAREPDKKFKETDSRGAFVEPSFFRIFDYDWIAGGPAEMDQPNTVVLSARNAQKYFGTTTGVVGKIIRLGGRQNARIIGVFRGYPDNTDFPYSIMASRASLPEFNGRPFGESFNSTSGSTQCFVLLNDRFTVTDWDRQMTAFVTKYKLKGADVTRYPMQPLRDIHFATELGGVSQGLMLSLLIIGAFLVVTACINFVNLATAQALTRSREVGVRKVLGSTRPQLFWQFMGEIAFITLIATAIALGLFQIGQTLMQQNLDGAFRFTFYFDPSVIGGLGLLVTGVILLSGVYPALVMAGFKPVMALAGKITTQEVGGFSVRRGLVVAQFAISQTLIIGMVVVASQLRFVQDKDLGFRKEAILTIRLPERVNQDLAKMSTFRNRVNQIAGVEKLSYSMTGAPQTSSVYQVDFRFNTRPDDEKFMPHLKYIDADYVDLYGINLVAGRNLYPSDTAREALVNETLVRKLGIRNPAQVLGKAMRSNGKKLQIVGVIKDFNQSSLHETIDPLFMTTEASSYYAANLHLQTGHFQEVISQLETAFNQVYPDTYFSPQFVDDQIERSYRQEQTMARLVNFFAGVAVLIGCLGLYGLVLFMVTRKTKEIGVRKVLGASVGNILWLFGQEFSRLIVVAFVLAAPVAWYVMRHWLQNFQYKIKLGPSIFLIAIITTILVAALTISSQAIKAALMNPVKSLRSD